MGRKRKISEKDAVEIRRRYFSPEPNPNGSMVTMPQLARLYKVSTGTIQQVVDRRGVYSGDRDTET